MEIKSTCQELVYEKKSNKRNNSFISNLKCYIYNIRYTYKARVRKTGKRVTN